MPVDTLKMIKTMQRTRGLLLQVVAHMAIRAYQLTLSSIAGRHCRHLPTCSCFMDEAIARHGIWAGGWMGLARFCRCQPWGTAGFDPVPLALPQHASWLRPWRYGYWRGPLRPAANGPSPDSPTCAIDN
jgi:putative membrane protein insertion efficiency factor